MYSTNELSRYPYWPLLEPCTSASSSQNLECHFQHQWSTATSTTTQNEFSYFRARSHCIKIAGFCIEGFRRIVCITVTLLFWVSLVVILYTVWRGTYKPCHLVYFSCSGIDVCFLGFLYLSLPASLFSELTGVTIAKTLQAQDHFAPVEVETDPVGNPGTSWSGLSFRRYPTRYFS